MKTALLFIPPVITQKFPIDVNPIPPLGLGYIASVLENIGLEVKIVDCLIEGWNNRVSIGFNLIRIGLDDEEIRKIISDFNPDIVGVNNLFSRQYKEAHKIFELAKGVDSDIITIAGGPHPTVMPEHTLKDDNVDYVIIGEGERVIEELVKNLKNKKKLANIDGLGFKQNGNIIVNPKRTFIEDLDSVPFPAWHLMNVEKYVGLQASHGKRKTAHFFPIITSRGCVAKCTFCSANKVWGRKHRFRSPKNVIKEMKILKERYGIEELLIEDDNFTLKPKRAEEICDLMIKEGLDFKWDTPNGVAAYTINKRLLSKMKEAGCYRVNLAVESGNQDTLFNIIKKPLVLSKLDDIVKWCRELDLEVGMFLVFGMPGDTLGRMWDSIKLASRLKIYHPLISIATPYPGSEIFDICTKNDYFVGDYKLENMHIKKPQIRTKDFGPYSLMSIVLLGKVYLKFLQRLRN
jgi:magnesium-protoporphyrin IX monomethyl ester (oxidative) cyclase